MWYGFRTVASAMVTNFKDTLLDMNISTDENYLPSDVNTFAR